MMKATLLGIIMTIVIVQVYTIGDVYINHLNYKETIGIYNFLGGGIFLFVGLILCAFRKAREIGKGVLIGSAIILVFGFATCSWNGIS
jgi:hypothetical protein